MTDTSTSAPRLELAGTRLFLPWLAQARASLAFTTYQAGKVFLIGMRPDGSLSVFERTFPRSMGLGVAGRSLWLASLYQLWRFEDFLDPGTVTPDGHDALYVPVNGHTTGDIDIHDIHAGPGGRPIFAVTLFNCIATIDDRNSFVPLWRPPFIDRLAAEDRCHLNGLAVDGERPAYVTCVGTGNVAESWRQRRRDGGVVIDVASGEVAAAGLSMPHSPRLHDGVLWLIQTGTGEFGRVDLATGRFEPVCFLPGFARGLAFVGHHAVIGVSRPRENRTFEGLALNERLAAAGADPRCCIAVVDLRTGDLVHQLMIEGIVQELYDVAVLPGVLRPKMLGFRTDEIRFAIRPGELSG
ncbi:TIGR03032 family protein [Allostella sp. ATCC 35155]|nr:TIGR03032 family protein [Stella sp. ATCC 35155]